MLKIRVGIVGYGNLGKGIEAGLEQSPDFELVSIFTRRIPNTLTTHSRVESYDDIFKFKDKIDVLILAGGSQKDIPIQGPSLAQEFNTVDCFDNHAVIAEYFNKMDKVTKKHRRVSTIAVGWDPGLFSLNRMLGDAILSQGKTYTFWGPGLSQGHSDVVRRVAGVKMAVQYTIPQDDMIKDIRAGHEVEYNSQKAHSRLVYVVADQSADLEKIRNEIVNIPDYFAPYETRVNFISEEEFLNEHQAMPHGGSVLHLAKTSPNNKAVYEFSLTLENNSEYTAAISIAFARATYRLYQEESYGAKTIFDIPLGLLSASSKIDLLDLL